MTNEQQEAFLTEKLKEFTDKMTEAAKDVIADVYCDYLPHVMSDTECNVAIQTENAIRNILEGRFTVDGDYLITNQRSVRIYLANSYGKLASNIYNTMPDKIENLTIKELEAKIKSLQSELDNAYRRY